MEKKSRKRSRGRPLSFDPAQALDAATRVFWMQGFDGASMDDLTEAMGINKPSLYAKFGNKRGLFLAAIDHYLDAFGRSHAARLMSAVSVRDAADIFLKSINGSASSDNAPPGCLVGAVATEMASRDNELRDKVAALVRQNEAFLADRFKDMGDAPMDETTLAELVVSLSHSLVNRARLGAKTEELDAYAERFLTAIFGPPD